MRRTITAVLVVVGVLGLGACSSVKDAAQQVTGKVQCGAATKLADQLPDGDNLDRTAIARGASIAGRIDSVLSKVPGDAVPTSITDAVHTAAVDLDAAEQTYDTDPAAAQAKAAEAVAAVRTAVTDAVGELGC